MEQPDFNSMGTASKLDYLDSILYDESQWTHQDALLHLASDGDPEVREKALTLFWDLADPTHIDFLMEIARNDRAIGVRRAAMTALGRFIYEGFVMEELDEEDYQVVRDYLVQVYTDSSEPVEIRRAALEALGFITDPDVEDLIREAYANEDRQMRISALFAMGRSGTRSWDNTLLQEMDNPDAEFRFEAVRAAGGTCFQEAAELIEKLTGDRNRDIRLAAIDALGKAGRPKSRGLLESLAQSRDKDVQDAAESALEELDFFESMELDGEEYDDEE